MCILSAVVERVISAPRIAAVRVNGVNVYYCVWSSGNGETVPGRGGILILVTELCTFVVYDYSARLTGCLIQVQFLATVVLLIWFNSLAACVGNQEKSG